MGTQYQPTNINAPRLPRVVDGDILLNLDDELIIIAVGSTPTITLPPAETIPSREIHIKSLSGTGAVIGSGGQTIDGMGAFSFTSVLEAVLVKSDGSNWVIVSGGASAAPCPTVCTHLIPPVAQGAAEVVVFRGLNIDGSVVIYGAAPVPILGSAVWASGGGAPTLDSMTVTMDTTLAAGNFCAAITVNGCSVLAPFTVIPV